MKGKKDLKVAEMAALSSSLIYRMKVESIFALQKAAMEKKQMDFWVWYVRNIINVYEEIGDYELLGEVIYYKINKMNFYENKSRLDKSFSF